MAAFVVVAARVLFVIAAAPGRLLIRWIDRRKADNGVAPLGGFLRGSVHAFVWFCAFVTLVMASGPAPARTQGVASAAPITSAPTRTPASSAAQVPARAVLEGAVVTRIIDGDTFQLSDARTVRVLGIDSCESDTPGGDLATSLARQLLIGSVGLKAEPGIDVDRYGRLLRYVQTSSGDFGQLMVGHDHTGVYQGDNGASANYVQRLYAHDLDHAANPPAGRECGTYPPPASVDDPDPVYVPNNDDGDDGESRFCRRHWWC